jgi:hypothetical protein
VTRRPRPPRQLGRTSSRWYRLRLQVKARREPCCRCGQPIDYQLKWPDPNSFSVDHYPHALSTHPHLAEDPGNLKAAHLVCNQSGGNKGEAPGLGEPSERW